MIPATTLSARSYTEDEALARSLIVQIVVMVREAWADYPGRDRQRIRQLASDVLAVLDNGEPSNARFAVIGDLLPTTANLEAWRDADPQSFHGWVRNAYDWYGLIERTVFVQRRPRVLVALRTLAAEHAREMAALVVTTAPRCTHLQTAQNSRARTA